MNRFLTSLAVVVAIGAAGCTETPLTLDWEVVFGPDADPASAQRVETRIVVGGCAGTTDLYAANVLPSAPLGPAPAALSPGRYGFAALAVDGQCRGYAAGCTELTLPVADGELVTITLGAEGAPDALCPTAECSAGTCTSATPDAGPDAPSDAPSDTPPDTPTDARMDARVVPPTPVLIAAGIGTPPSIDLSPSEDAWALSVSSDAFSITSSRQASGVTRLSVDGALVHEERTTRDNSNGDATHVSASLFTRLVAGPHSLGHAVNPSRATLVDTRWAYAVLPERAIPSGELASTTSEATEAVMISERSVVLIAGRADVVLEAEGDAVSLDVGVDGVPCAVTGIVQVNEESRNFGASLYCIRPSDPGMRTFFARAVGNSVDISIPNVVLSYAVVPEPIGRIHGAELNSADVDVTGPGVLLAFAWGRFSGVSDFVDLSLAVDGVPCGRSLTGGDLSDATVTCVWPVDAEGTLSLTTAQDAGIGASGVGVTVGWLFLAQ